MNLKIPADQSLAAYWPTFEAFHERRAEADLRASHRTFRRIVLPEKQGRPWTPEEDATLRHHWAHHTSRRIAAIMGRSPTAIARRGQVIGLRRS